MFSKYEEAYTRAAAERTACDEIAFEAEKILNEHPEVREALVDALIGAFPKLGDEGVQVGHYLTDEFGIPAAVRWWTTFDMLHEAAPWRQIDPEVDHGEHQATT